ncbi:unnamed protein product, partial [Discosporangium mesarthrocarpum]
MRSRRKSQRETVEIVRSHSVPVDSVAGTVPAALFLDSSSQGETTASRNNRPVEQRRAVILNDISLYPRPGNKASPTSTPEIPTEDFTEFFTSLVEGMRGDAVYLAKSTTSLLSNTLNVVTAPLGVIASATKPLFGSQVVVKENMERQPAELVSGGIKQAVSGGDAAGVLTYICSNSPTPHKSGKTLDAVRLTLSKADECSGAPSQRHPKQRHHRGVSEACLSLGVAAQHAGATADYRGTPETNVYAQETGAGAIKEPLTGRRLVGEGSRIDLRQLERSTGASGPQIFQCRGGEVVILGKQRMLCVRPEVAAAGPGVAPTALEQGPRGKRGEGKWREEGRFGMVTWEVKFPLVESFCVNVSSGAGPDQQVGDVLVDITARPLPRSVKPAKYTFCLANPSDCLELLKTVQTRWHPTGGAADQDESAATAAATTDGGGSMAEGRGQAGAVKEGQ